MAQTLPHRLAFFHQSVLRLNCLKSGNRKIRLQKSITIGTALTYEFKVNDLAEEFGVHRNTIRNWIKSGRLAAEKGPGKRYLLKWPDYLQLCKKYGRTPRDTVAVQQTPPDNHPLTPAPPPLLLNHPFEPIHDDPSWADSCLGCGSCGSACPIAGIDNLDPRKIVRMAALGLNDELLGSDWPWKCTLCGRCEEHCPMTIEIVQLMRRLRAKRPRAKVPGPLHRGIETCLEKGNNLGISREDVLGLLNRTGRELAHESCPGFAVPIDKRGAKILMTMNSREPFAAPDHLKWWWKIFYAAGESWTLSSENWEGVNWGYFTGDDAAMKTITGRIVDNMERLGCRALLLPEYGHASSATRLGFERWFPEVTRKYTIYTVFDLLQKYLKEQRITVDNRRHTVLTTYHDPCHYGRLALKTFGHGYFKEGRAITRACCPSFVEMEPGGRDNYCCGGGGGIWAMSFHPERVFHGRIKARQIRESGAGLVITPCHNCHDQLNRSLKTEFNLRIEVKYLSELVADSIRLPATGRKYR